MEINVTSLVVDGDMFEFSASCAERGRNAGPETWANAKAEAAERPILTEDQLDDFRCYVKGFGAWEEAEIAAWNLTECNALFVQMVAGDIREAQSLCSGDGIGDIDWEAYEALGHEGTVSSRVFASGDEIFYYVGT